MAYFPSLGTHFNARIDIPTLEQIRVFGFRWARMDCQAADPTTMLEMIRDAWAADLRPFPIVYDLERLDLIPVGDSDVEWGNEPDGDIAPSRYRTQLNKACALAAKKGGLRLWAPAISNLDRDSLRWLEQVRGVGWPKGLHGISVHRYGDGTFEYAHDGFANREAEVARLLELCDGLPFIVTEFGYPSDTVTVRTAKRHRFLRPGLQLSEEEAAANIAKEWDFWRGKTDVPVLYQINDGPNDGESYGIRRCLPDGTLTDWKPAAFEVPQGDDPMADLAPVSANTVFAREDLVEVPGRPGEFGLRCPPGAETLLSPKTSGHHELRTMGSLGGPDETCKVSGDLVYFWQNSQGGRFAWRLADAEEK